MLRLGVNIDHIATLRNARGGLHPDPVHAARLAHKAGAHGITAHLREDRRHIRDADLIRLKNEVSLPLNMEMAATDEMLAIALKLRPHACCIVPENRAELTTEGGLNVAGNKPALAAYTAKLQAAGIRVSLFLAPDEEQILAAKAINADIVELHAGTYCYSSGSEQADELQRLINAAKLLENIGIECHAGHGLTYETTPPIAAIPNMMELNIGHFLIGEAMENGLGAAIEKMLAVMQQARKGG